MFTMCFTRYVYDTHTHTLKVRLRHSLKVRVFTIKVRLPHTILRCVYDTHTLRHIVYAMGVLAGARRALARLHATMRSAVPVSPPPYGLRAQLV